MARYKDYDLNQSKFIPVVFADQITRGSFEYTINVLVDEHLDMSIFDERYTNDDVGRPAYDPSLLVKIILSAYARGFTSSRDIEKLCRENVVFMALSADTQPHFTTIAKFVGQMDGVIQPLFTEILMVCDAQGLIGHDLFAIDGCKMPSNASKEHSGTHAEMAKKHKKIDRAVRRMLRKHHEEDQSQHENDHTRRAAEEKNIEELRKASRKIKKYLKTSGERSGLSGNVVKGNITDNDSAKMKTSHGTIQGYNGIAAVDNKHQIIVGAEAFGQGPENNLLMPMIENVKGHLGQKYTDTVKVTADSGFHSKAALEDCLENAIDAYIADGNYRKRDPRFIERDRYQPKDRKAKWFIARDFEYDAMTNSCRCPAGKAMWTSGKRRIDGHDYQNFTGYLNDCKHCPLQQQCMRKQPSTYGRQVSIKLNNTSTKRLNAIDRMKLKIDSDKGRHVYSQRLGAVEPVFGNINTNKTLSRFSLRGKTKVNAQYPKRFTG